MLERQAGTAGRKKSRQARTATRKKIQAGRNGETQKNPGMQERRNVKKTKNSINHSALKEKKLISEADVLYLH